MASVNRVILVGHLGKDPEVRYAPDGAAIANITLATSESYSEKETGTKKEVTEWHRVTFYRRLAEIAGEYLKKGSLIYVEGKIRTRKWQDQEGRERYSTEIQADAMKMLGPRAGAGEPRGESSASASSAPSSAPAKRSGPMENFEEDVPF